MTSPIQAIVGVVTGIVAELFVYSNLEHTGLLRLLIMGILFGAILGFVTLTPSFIGVVIGVIVAIMWSQVLMVTPFSGIWQFLMALFVGACASNGTGMFLP